MRLSAEDYQEKYLPDPQVNALSCSTANVGTLDRDRVMSASEVGELSIMGSEVWHNGVKNFNSATGLCDLSLQPQFLYL